MTDLTFYQICVRVVGVLSLVMLAFVIMSALIPCSFCKSSTHPGYCCPHRRRPL